MVECWSGLVSNFLTCLSVAFAFFFDFRFVLSDRGADSWMYVVDKLAKCSLREWTRSVSLRMAMGERYRSDENLAGVCVVGLQNADGPDFY